VVSSLEEGSQILVYCFGGVDTAFGGFADRGVILKRVGVRDVGGLYGYVPEDVLYLFAHVVQGVEIVEVVVVLREFVECNIVEQELGGFLGEGVGASYEALSVDADVVQAFAVEGAQVGGVVVQLCLDFVEHSDEFVNGLLRYVWVIGRAFCPGGRACFRVWFFIRAEGVNTFHTLSRASFRAGLLICRVLCHDCLSLKSLFYYRLLDEVMPAFFILYPFLLYLFHFYKLYYFFT
jgi:hypothetical protein